MDSMTTFMKVCFSPGGRLMQVEAAFNASKMGSTVIGVCGRNCVILGVEKRETNVLQINRTTRKILKIHETIAVGYAGLSADARVIINRSMAECQSYAVLSELTVTVDFIAKFISDLKHKYTHTVGYRPFAVVCLIGGFKDDGLAHLYETQPSGDYIEWKANAIGRYRETVFQFLEANYNERLVQTVDGTIKLALKGLLQVARLGPSNFEICKIEKNKPIVYLSQDEILNYVNQIR